MDGWSCGTVIYCIRLWAPKVPRNGHLHAGLTDVRQGVHDQLHGNGILVIWWGAPHGAWSIGDPRTPVKLNSERNKKREATDYTI